MRALLLEAVLVAGIGAAVAFAANGLSPRGLKLSRDFFGTGNSVPTTNSLVAVTNSPGALTNSAAAALQQLTARLQAKGIALADSNRVVQLFRDPRYEQGLVVFIDSREDSHYQQGHIPGAYQFDYYRPEAYLPTVLPVCQIAAEIVVYCNGGNCEDSEFTANFLLAAGIPAEKLLVYAGGMTEWTANKLPIEIGVRQSGNIQTPSAPEPSRK